MILHIALYRDAARPSQAPMVLPYIDKTSAYGVARISEPVTVDFPDIAIAPADALAAIDREEAQVMKDHERRLADIAARRAQVTPAPDAT